MIQPLVEWISHALSLDSNGWALALTATFIWGALSVALSPCHLASIPLIIGFIDESGDRSVKRAFVVSSLFALGMLVTIALIGVLTALAGRIIGDLGGWVNYVMVVVFFIVGLHFLDVIPAPWSGPGQAPVKRKGLFAAFMLGLIFGLALGPCAFAFMAPVLMAAFKLSQRAPLFATLILTIYGIGHCAVIVAAGTSAEMVQNYLNWNEHSRGATILRKICGVLILIAGLYLLYTAP